MRLRNVKGAKEAIGSNEYVIQEPEQQKGRWNEVFKNNHPIQIEIGMGKGKFISTLAEKNPDINYIGIERYASVLLRALTKRAEGHIENLFFICMDAEKITEVFEKEEVAQIYLNFSDPWPKDRHARRRLTSRRFLEYYDKILSKEGEIIFKTDNRSLFEFSLEEVQASRWKIKNHTFHLHQSEYAEDNVMTEYEEKFSAEGKPIHRLCAYR